MAVAGAADSAGGVTVADDLSSEAEETDGLRNKEAAAERSGGARRKARREKAVRDGRSESERATTDRELFFSLVRLIGSLRAWKRRRREEEEQGQ